VLEKNDQGESENLGAWLDRHGLSVKNNILTVVSTNTAVPCASPHPPAFQLMDSLAALMQQQGKQALPAAGPQAAPSAANSLQLLQQQLAALANQEQPPALDRSTLGVAQPLPSLHHAPPATQQQPPPPSCLQEERLQAMQGYLAGVPAPPSSPCATQLGREIADLRVCGCAVDLRELYLAVRGVGEGVGLVWCVGLPVVCA